MLEKMLVEVAAQKESQSLVPNFAKSEIQGEGKKLVPKFAESEVEKVKCRNEELEGKNHPETGVPYTKKIVEVEGTPVEVVVPEFNSIFDAQLDPEMYQASDPKQFKECNNQLKEAIDQDPKLKERFTTEQLEQIEDNETPDGYTWHHDAETGEMQLVDSEVHMKTGHTGGRSIWGGGSDNR